jgi:hypothetical protein
MAKWGLLFSSFLLILSACGKVGFETNIDESLQSSLGDVDEPTPPPAFEFTPLLWEPVRVGSNLWSEHVFELIDGDAKDLLEAEDFHIFCPQYDSLSRNQKINAAGMLISAMVRYESNYEPTARYNETSMGTDPVTGQPVYSEGLLQLSYQDTQWAPYCDFHWEADKNLSPTDPAKTILDPIRNLDCGIRILAKQVKSKSKIIIGSGAYWAVIKSDSTLNKIDKIAALVKGLEFCN